jgi:hypothetical protein
MLDTLNTAEYLIISIVNRVEALRKKYDYNPGGPDLEFIVCSCICQL